jgi:hypothetical protein
VGQPLGLALKQFVAADAIERAHADHTSKRSRISSGIDRAFIGWFGSRVTQMIVSDPVASGGNSVDGCPAAGGLVNTH